MGCDIHTIVQIKKKNKWEYVPELPDEFNERNYSTFSLLANVRNSFNTKGFEPKGLPDDLGGTKFGWESHKDKYRKFYETDTSSRIVMPDGEIRQEFDKCFKTSVTKEEHEKYVGCKGCCGDNYYIYDFARFGGKKEEVPYAKIYKTFQDYLDDLYEYDYDKDLDDYGEWAVDFSCEDFHSHSYLTLKELKDFDYDDYSSVKCKVVKEFFSKFFELGGKLPDGMTIEDTIPQSFGDCCREAFEKTVVVKWKNLDMSDLPVLEGMQKLSEIAKKYNVTDENIRIVFAFDN